MTKYRYSAVTIFFTSLLSLLSACSTQTAYLPTQDDLNLGDYAGVWYEQALLPNRFQKECVSDVSAKYTPLDSEQLRVRNQCQKADGTVSVAEGIGRLNGAITPLNPAILEVRFAPNWLSFLPMVWGDYWIIKTVGNYQYSLVGSPDREYLWVLSRDRKADMVVVNELLEYAGTLGFDIDKVEYTKQNTTLE